MLFVPVTDLTLPRSRSYELFSEGYFLTRANMDWYEANYLGGGTLPDDVDAMRRDPRVSPLLADDLEQLAERGLASAYVAVAGFDPLRDEGNAYARKLSDAGVATTLRVHTDAVHPFINILATDLGRRCMAEAIGALRMALHVRCRPAARPLARSHLGDLVVAVAGAPPPLLTHPRFLSPSAIFVHIRGSRPHRRSTVTFMAPLLPDRRRAGEVSASAVARRITDAETTASPPSVPLEPADWDAP